MSAFERVILDMFVKDELDDVEAELALEANGEGHALYELMLIHTRSLGHRLVSFHALNKGT